MLDGPRRAHRRHGPDPLPPLYGFVRTTPKESNLVQVLIETPPIDKYKFPILAAWQYGLGKSVAFTSDARTLAKGSTFWDKDWANSDLYAKFWEQTVDWVLRPTETGKHLFMTTEHKDGKIRVIVEAQDADKTPITDVELRAGITAPGFNVGDDRKTELKFEQKNAGVFEAVIPADQVGAYFINIQAKWKKDGKEFTDNVRAGVTIPYSPEFAEMESNPTLLEKIGEMTGGKAYRDDSKVLEDAANNAEVFRTVPESHANLQALWPWMVFLTALCLLLDVATRRIAIQPETVWLKAVAHLASACVAGPSGGAGQVAGVHPAAQEPQGPGRRDDGQGKSREEIRGGGRPRPAAAPTVVPARRREKPKPVAPPKAAKKEEEAGDFASRLMRAKKKAMEDRDKDKPK